MNSRWIVLVALLGLSLGIVLAGCGGSSGPALTSQTTGQGGTAYTIGGQVNGLISGKTLTLQNNGGDDLVITQNGVFSFATSLSDGDTYNVTISAQPSGGNCTVTNGTGTVSTVDVTTVTIVCNFSGYLDVNFGNNGLVQSNNPTGNSSVPDEVGNDVAVDSQGRIVVVGSIFNGIDNDMAIWRFNSDGTPDTTFGTNGFVSHDNAAGGSYYDVAFAVTIDADDNIYVTGSSFGSNLDSNGSKTYDMVIWKYKPDGTLDTSFNSTGIVTSDLTFKGASLGMERGYDIALDSTGRIIVAGTAPGLNGSGLAVWRYLSDGSIDTSFGNNSIYGTNLFLDGNVAGGSGNNNAEAVFIGARDDIYVTGYSDADSSSATDYEIVVLKLNRTDGNYDTNFNSTGKVIYGTSGGNDYGVGITMSSSSIYVAATMEISGTTVPVILKFDASGNLDTTFGTSGEAYPAPNSTGDTLITDIAIDSNGRIVVPGFDISASDYAVWRLDASGQPDQNFGVSGKASVLSPYTAGTALESITIDSQGRILAAGFYYVDATSRNNMFLVRVSP